MGLREYLDTLRGKRVAVIGIGVSNTPLIEALLSAGVDVTACDKKNRDQLGELGEKLEAAGCRLCLGENYLAALDHDLIFRTPGLHPRFLDAARAKGCAVTSEMEVFFRLCPCPIVAVTGSDGKTTTTTIIAGLLQAAGKTVHLGGNIGHPLLTEVDEMQPDHVAVVELSSFQLMDMDRSPQIAVITNLSPNHLDVHRDYQEYIDAKANLFRYQTTADRAVFNLDYEETAKLSKQSIGKCICFTRKTTPQNGTFLKNDAIWMREDGSEREVLPLSGIKLPGWHNVENYMAAIAALNRLVPDEVIRRYAAEFGGVEHRIELVRTLRGVRYYNDSIASSPARTIAGLRCFPEKVILMAGGKDKGIPYDEIGPVILEHVKKLVLCGATAGKIRAAVEAAPGYTPGCLEILETDDFRRAVELCALGAGEGDVVILSPASTSFDRFKNFMERGNVFKEIVNSLT